MRIAILLIMLTVTGCGAGNNTHPSMPLGTGVASPMLTVLFPSTAPFGSPTFTLTLNGNNFGLDATVYWNGSPTRTIFVTSNQLMAQITEADMQISGMVPVFVRSASQNTNTVTFDVSVQ